MTCPDFVFQNAFLPTMPEDLLVQARSWMGLEGVHWYSKCWHRARLSTNDQPVTTQALGYGWGPQLPLVTCRTTGLYRIHDLLAMWSLPSYN